MAQSIVGIAWAYPLKRQSAYATANPNADITQSHPFLGADMFEHTPNVSTNAEHLGKGHEFATRKEILSWDAQGRRQFHCTTKIAGWGFAFHLGDVTTTNPAGSAYQHVMEYQDPNGAGYYGSGRQQPVFTVIERVTSNLVRKFRSMQIRAVELTGALNDWAILTLELQGSGYMERIAPTGYTFPDSTDPVYGGEGVGLLRNASLTFQGGVSGSLADMSCSIQSYRFRSEMQYFDAQGYCPGSGYLTSGDPTSGQIRNKLEFARRAVMLEFVVEAGTDNTIFAQLEANTLLQAILTLEGATITGAYDHLLEINVPSLKYATIPITADGDLITFAVATQVMYNQNEANPFTIRVINTTSGYLASS